jgi:predicted dehydrogenase
MGGDGKEKKVKVGLVGAGFIGQVAHLVNHVENPNVEIVGLAELRPRLGEQVCRRYDIPNYYPDHKAMLADSDVEAVVAVVRRHHTAYIALDVLNAKRHLFTEKPMAQTCDQAERLVRAAEEHGLVYAVGYMRRHDSGVQIAKKMLDELRETDELGAILSVRFYVSAGGDYCNISGCVESDEPKPMNQIWPIAPDWLPENMHLEYEHFLNVCSHDLNLIRYMFDQRPEVKFVDYRRYRGSTVVMDFGDFSGIFQWGDTLLPDRWEEGMEIYFEKGRLRLDLMPAFLRNQPARVELYKDNEGEPGQIITPTPDWTWAFRREDEAFIADVAANREPLASGADSLEDMRLLDDIWKHIAG